MKNTFNFSREIIKRKSKITIGNAVCFLSATAIFAGGFFAPSVALAAVTVTPASGGTNISIDTTSASGGSGTYQILSGPTINETLAGEISVGTHTISLPPGWEFNTSSTVTVVRTAGNIEPGSQVVTPGANSFTFTITSASTANSSLAFIMSSMKVRPTGSVSPTTGLITHSGADVAGVTNGVTSLGTLSTIPGTPTQLKIENSATGGTEIDTATVPSGTTVTAYSNTRDQFGNLAANVAATWSLSGSTGGVANGNLVPAGDNKNAVFTGNLVGTTVIQAVGSFTDTTGVITVVPGPVSATNSTIGVTPSAIVASSGANPITVTVTARDAAGNLISGKTASMAVTGTDNTITPAPISTDSNGVAVFTISSTKAEAKTTTATVDGVMITSVTPSITFTHGAASQLSVVIQPAITATAGVAFAQQPVVNVLDSFGNLVTDSAVVVTAVRNSTTGSQTLFGTLTATASGGVATFTDLSYREATTMKIDFTSGSLALATANNIAVSPNVPATVTFTQQPATTGTVDSILTTQPIVKVVDAYGNNVVDGTSVSLVRDNGIGDLRGTLTKTTTSGTVTFNDIGYNSSADSFTIIATAGVISSIPSASVGPLLAGIINTFTLSAGVSQIAGIPFGVSVIGAVDQFVNPASGVVTVSASSGDGNSPSGAPATFGTINVNNGSGSANSTLVNAVSTVLRGTVGLITADTGAISVSAGAQTHIVLTSDKTTINANGADTATITAQLKDTYGNSNLTSGVSIVFSAPRGTVVTSPVPTNGSGQAATAFNSGTDRNSGDVAVTASSAGLTSGTKTIAFNDVTSPNAPVITAPSSSPIVINIANKNTQILSGTAEAGSTVKIWVDGGATTVTKIATDGTFAFTNAELQTAGIVSGTDYSVAKIVTVKAIDAALNQSAASNAISYTQDTLAPSISSYTLNGSSQNVAFNPTLGSVTIALTANEPVTWTSLQIKKADNASIYKTYNIDAGYDGINSATQMWSGTAMTSGVLADGEYVLEMHIKDSANNDVDNLVLSPYRITVDRIAPTVVLSYSVNPAKAGAVTITVTYSEPIVGTPQISINQPGSTDIPGATMIVTGGTNNKVWTYSYVVNTATGGTYVDGTATVSLSAVADVAGNTTGAPTNSTFTIDTAAPSVDGVTAPVADAVYKTSVPAMFTPNDTGSGAVTCSYAINGIGSNSISCTKGQAANATISVSGFTDGRNSLTFTVIDAAGNPASVTPASFVVDKNNTLTVGAVGADFTTIQEAINKATAGDAINVAAGTYAETLTVNKSVTIDGGGATITAPVIVTADNVTLTNLIFSGNLGSSAVINLDTDTAHSGITISNNHFTDSITTYYVIRAGDYKTNLAITGNTFTGSTAGTDNALIFLGSGGSDINISDNTFSAFPSTYSIFVIQHNGKHNGDETARTTGLAINNNNINFTDYTNADGAEGISVRYADNVQVNGNTLTGSATASVYEAGITLASVISTDKSAANDNIVSGFSQNIRILRWYAGEGFTNGVAITGNILTNGVITDGGASRGTGLYLAGTNLLIQNNEFSNNANQGIFIPLADQAGGNDISGTIVSDNKIFSNTTYGINNLFSFTLDASPNWWGSATGPAHSSNSLGTGNAVSDKVNFRPWYLSSAMTGLDSANPTPTISSIASPLTNLSPIGVSVNFGEAITGFTIDDVAVGNGIAGNFAGSGANYSFDVTPSTSGAVTVDIAAQKAQDLSGNYNTTATQFSINYDVVLPTASVTSPSGGGSYKGDIAIMADASDASGIQKVEFWHNSESGALISTDTSAPYTASWNSTDTAEGSHSIYVKAYDNAGNVKTSTNITVTLDRTAPVVEITVPTADSKVNGADTIGFTDGESTAPKCSIDNTNWTACTSGVSTFGGLTGFGSLTDGSFTLYLRDIDSAGNLGATSVSLIKDSVAPFITNRNPNSGSTGIKLNANIIATTSEAVLASASNVTLQKGSETPITVVVSGSGTNVLNINPSVELESNTKYTITLSGITDIAGNALPISSWPFITTTTYSIPISNGWNLISLPVNPSSLAIGDVLGELNDSSKIESVLAYDGATKEWLVYHPGSSSLGSLDTMTAGLGYWINYTASTNSDLEGEGGLLGVGGQTIPPQHILSSGWNLIGYYQLENEVASTPPNALFTLTNDNGGKLWSALSTFDNEVKQYKSSIRDTDAMNPGEGYWVFMKQPMFATSYIYGPGQSQD